MVADAAGVAETYMVRKWRRARQNLVGFVETGQAVEMKLCQGGKTIRRVSGGKLVSLNTTKELQQPLNTPAQQHAGTTHGG